MKDYVSKSNEYYLNNFTKILTYCKQTICHLDVRLLRTLYRPWLVLEQYFY